MEKGQVCVKLAGRDAGNKCVIVEVIDKNFVTVDGGVRRKRCNIDHLYPINLKLDIKSGSHEEIAAAFKAQNLMVWETKPKEQKPKPIPKRVEKSKPKPKKAADKKTAKKSTKKADKKSEEKPAKVEAKPAAKETKKEE